MTWNGCRAPAGCALNNRQVTVRQLRLVVTVDDVDAALAFYCDVLGMPVAASFPGEDGGRVVVRPERSAWHCRWTTRGA